VLKRGHGSQKDSDKLSFHAFDLLELDGKDLTGLPNIERKERLEALLGEAEAADPCRRPRDRRGREALHGDVQGGQEGIISKTIDGRYRSARTRNWVKVKCTLRQEFVLIGWKKSTREGAAVLLAAAGAAREWQRGLQGQRRHRASTPSPARDWRRNSPGSSARPRRPRSVAWRAAA
jgi:bifunctional non-homologous end joining protein LigD